jgi:hypothetical protein
VTGGESWQLLRRKKKRPAVGSSTIMLDRTGFKPKDEVEHSDPEKQNIVIRFVGPGGEFKELKELS